VQALAVGVTAIVAETDNGVEFVAINDAISFEPLAAMPIDGSEFVQEYVVPVTGLLNNVPATELPLHATISDGTITVGVGFTVMVKELGMPKHPFTVGVTVIVAVTGIEPVLVAVKEGKLPIPLAASPMLRSEFDQANVPPVGELVKV
jgi:hypothetical protein